MNCLREKYAKFGSDKDSNCRMSKSSRYNSVKSSHAPYIDNRNLVLSIKRLKPTGHKRQGIIHDRSRQHITRRRNNLQ